jgi:tripartite-type tricarboxylate transporter receptor subunit TctC
MKALADGDIDLTMSTAPYTMPLVQKGVVKPLAVSSKKRMIQLPDVPTLREFDIDTRGSWMGVFVPSGAPGMVVDKLFKAFKKAAEYPENKNNIQDLGMWVHTSESPTDFRDFVKSETERLGEAAKRADIYVL